MIEYSDKELIKDGTIIAEYADSVIESTKFGGRNFRKVLICILFAKIINGCNAVIELNKIGYSIESSILVRSLLETLFYLGLCTANEELCDLYWKNNINSLKKTYNIVKSKPKIYSETLRKEIEKIYNDLVADIGNTNGKRLRADEAAKKAGMEEIYEYAYRHLSDAEHSNPGYLLEKFAKHNKEQVTELALGPIPTEINLSQSTANRLLLIAIDKYCRFFRIKIENSIKGLILKYSNSKQW